MRCINRVPCKRWIPASRWLSVLLCILFLISMAGCSKKTQPVYTCVLKYEAARYDTSLYKGEFFSNNLCVTESDVALTGFENSGSFLSAGLFDIRGKKVLCAKNIHEKLFPASTTKILTAYLALKYGNLDDMVTVSENAVTFSDPEASLAGLKAGDTLSLHDLLCALLLYSANDAANAIAEHISGSVEAFAEKMNEEAVSLGATNSHFVNPHGLQDENHYTTAYDLYLIFNACVKNQSFLDIISLKSYTGTVTAADGTARTLSWSASNFYSAGKVPEPNGVTVVGGKTGTTDEAGSCVILYCLNTAGNPYISVIMGAPGKAELYANMSAMLAAGIGD